MAQIVDVSAAQWDVSRDLLIGARAAWQAFNTQGGLHGRPIQHAVFEVDGSAFSVQQALTEIRHNPRYLALCGTAGDRTAHLVKQCLQQTPSNLVHAAPWLHTPDASDPQTFTIFASRQAQIRHALQSLASLGVAELRAVNASHQVYALAHPDVERVATDLKLQLTHQVSGPSLPQTGRQLSHRAPAILLFLGGTPELAQFIQRLEPQQRPRYVVALADVNLHTLRQLSPPHHTCVVATQIVPMVNASLPVVRTYRETLARLFDEAPNSLSLAGYLGARYVQALLQTLDSPPSRQNVLHAFQHHRALDLDGFRIKVNNLRPHQAYVTQSMLRADGRLIG